MPDHSFHIRSGVLIVQPYHRMIVCVHSEYFIGESLTDLRHTIKIQNDMFKIIQAKAQSFCLGTRYRISRITYKTNRAMSFDTANISVSLLIPKHKPIQRKYRFKLCKNTSFMKESGSNANFSYNLSRSIVIDKLSLRYL